MFSISHIYVSKFTLVSSVFMVWIGATILTFQSWKYIKRVQVISKWETTQNNDIDTNIISKNPTFIQEPLKILIVAFPR